MNSVLKKSFQFTLVYIFIGVYMVAAVPNFLTSIYAEDGQTYLQDALNTGGLQNLFTTAGGYADLPARAIAAIVSLFPATQYPYIYGIFTVLVMLICVSIIYSTVSPVFQNRNLAIYFSLILVILPIARFESIGNVTNLHFFFFTASAFVFIHFIYLRSSTKSQLLFVFIAALSVPLCAFLFIFILYKWQKNTIYLKNPKYFLLTPFFPLLLGSLLNLLISWGDTTSRTPRNSNSIVKISYLYFDRVVGSSFVPFWGRVSSDNNDILVSHSPFVSPEIRVMVSILLMVVLIFLVTRLDPKHKSVGYFVIFASIVFSILIGFFYNLEPRYCIFPSYLLIFTSFLCLLSLRIRGLDFFIVVAVLLLALNASHETESRKNSLRWKTQVFIASTDCRDESPTTRISFRIAPFRSDTYWSLKIPCSRLS